MVSSTRPRHSLVEDVLAFLAGTTTMALGLSLCKAAGLVTGGTAGLGFLAHYTTGYGVGAAFFVVNLPFYVLALARFGWRFTLRTVAAVGLLSVITDAQGHWIVYAHVQPLYGAILSGLLFGTGLLILFRHGASLGGVGILALYAQERLGWQAGWVQMAIDVLIVLAAFLVVAPQNVAYSLISMVMLNLVLAFNHRPDRYIAR